MNNNQPNLNDVDQQIRINELRESAREAAGGEMTDWENPDCPPEIAEQFWSNVLAYESAGETCHFIQLEEMGIALPVPQELDDAGLTAKLWEVIESLSKRDVFLSQTNHMSDRELYEYLWHEGLREFTPDFPPGSGWTCCLDILGSGSEDDCLLYLQYYADNEYREQWRKDWPNDPIPPHVDPPYDRDRRLPQPPC